MNKAKNTDKFEKQVNEYKKPEIRIVEFDTQSTTVLGNCSGWKSGYWP